VQLLECRDFLHNEAAFMEWLHMAILLASSAVLMLAVGARGRVSPLDPPRMHIAEKSALCLLPASCVLVAYSIWVYRWRFRRLTSMRHKRVDDRVGPNLMLVVVVAALAGALGLNILDVVRMAANARGGGGGGGGDDDAGGGAEPGTLRLGGAAAAVAAAAAAGGAGR
jgi:hypothetical protein